MYRLLGVSKEYLLFASVIAALGLILVPIALSQATNVGLTATPDVQTTATEATDIEVSAEIEIPDLPEMPDFSCPAFAKFKKLPEDTRLGPIIRYLSTNHPDLHEFVTSCQWDDDEFRARVKEALEKNDSWRTSCGHFSEYRTQCESAKARIDCGRLDEAIDKCHNAFDRCRQLADKYEERYRETREEVEDRLNQIEERWEKSLAEIRPAETETETGARETSGNSSPLTARATFVMPHVLERAEAKIAEHVLPRIEGLKNTCYVEEVACDRIRQMKDRCEHFVEECAPRCDFAGDLVSRCDELVSDVDKLVDKLLHLGKKSCRFKEYHVDVEEAENESISNAEVLPVLIVTVPNVTAEQESQQAALVESQEKILDGDNYDVYRARVRANGIEDLRKLEHIESVKVDHVTRAVEKRGFSRPGERGQIFHEEHLAILEAIKAELDDTSDIIVTDKQEKLLKSLERMGEVESSEARKGFMYKLLRLLGAKAKDELAEADKIEESASDLEDVSQSLESLADSQESVETKGLLIEQANKIKSQLQDLRGLAEEKRDKARGLFSFLFGG